MCRKTTIAWSFLFFLFVSSFVLEKDREAYSKEGPTYEEVYKAGHVIGQQLAKDNGYYKGDSYIESECTLIVTKIIEDSPTSYLGRAFISGCQDGYKGYFGK